MFLIKLIMKAALLPVLLILLLLKWVGIFLTSISAAVLNLVSGLCGFLGVACYFLGMVSGKEAFALLSIGFCLFMLPNVAEWVLKRVTWIAYNLSEFIKA